MTDKPVIAAFDFDGTLTYSDTLLPFILFTSGPLKTAWGLLPTLPSLLSFALGNKSRQETKETVMTSFFSGRNISEMDTLGESFASQKLGCLLRPEGMDRLRWHQNQGHRCILISASFDFYLRPWAASVGIPDIITSRLETHSNGIVTGKIQGKNCWGPEKTRRLTELLGPKDQYTLYAYGDSKGDKELLALADHPYYRTFS